jgi:hypothetical protein
VELFNDGGTSIVAKNYKILDLNKDIDFDVNRIILMVINGHTESKRLLRIRHYKQGIRDSKVLYFEAENIDFFNKIILSDFFETSYLCATREGMGVWNHKKSIIDHI